MKSSISSWASSSSTSSSSSSTSASISKKALRASFFLRLRLCCYSKDKCQYQATSPSPGQRHTSYGAQALAQCAFLQLLLFCMVVVHIPAYHPRRLLRLPPRLRHRHHPEPLVCRPRHLHRLRLRRRRPRLGWRCCGGAPLDETQQATRAHHLLDCGWAHARRQRRPRARD